MAAVAVVALASVLFLQPGKSPQAPPVASAPAPGPATDLPLQWQGTEAEYLAAFREFSGVGESRERMPTPVVENIETGWAELLQVEDALAEALAQSPNDPFLNRKMLELRARQLGFLRQLAALDHSNRRLTI